MGTTKPKDLDKEKLQVGDKKEEKKAVKIEKPKVEVKSLIRMLNTDLNGEKPVLKAIQNIKGIGNVFAKAVVKVSGINPRQKIGMLNQNDIQKLEEIIKNPSQFEIPSYLLNRRKDRETGKNIHLTSSDLDVARKFDIKRYVDLKNYRGWRHMLGQPVRGQSTRSHFREKGRIVGVLRKSIKIQMQKTGEEGKKKEEKK